MRPTPTETLRGIAGILRETVMPTVTDSHARTQLHQVITVLNQLEVPDPAGADAERTALEDFILELRAWRAANEQANSNELLTIIGRYLGGTP
jgi:hypothetical protein